MAIHKQTALTWPESPTCPDCGSEDLIVYMEAERATRQSRLYKCAACGSHLTVTRVEEGPHTPVQRTAGTKRHNAQENRIAKVLSLRHKQRMTHKRIASELHMGEDAVRAILTQHGVNKRLETPWTTAEQTCANCGKTYIRRNNPHGRHSFCTYECLYAFRSKRTEALALRSQEIWNENKTLTFKQIADLLGVSYLKIMRARKRLIDEGDKRISPIPRKDRAQRRANNRQRA